MLGGGATRVLAGASGGTVGVLGRSMSDGATRVLAGVSGGAPWVLGGHLMQPPFCCY